jgi:amidase
MRHDCSEHTHPRPAQWMKDMMMSHRYTLAKEQRAFAFDPTQEPALRVSPGDTVTYETGDAAYARLCNGETVEEIGLDKFNAVTGPVYVEGAEPGDALKVEVLDVRVTRAWSVWLPQFGGLGANAETVKVREILLRDGRAYITDELSVPLRPMIGCIGVAPAEGTGSTFMPTYPFGGNMDLKELVAGATIYLPVQVTGGLLSIGDLHAAMGNAEPTWVGLEAAGEATVRIGVVKGMKITYPRVRSGNETLVMGMGDSLADAQQQAIDAAYALLTNEWGLSPFDAYAYMSAAVDIRLGGPLSNIVLAAVPDR